MASDTKKSQTLINKAAEAATAIRQYADELDALVALYDAQAVDPTGTALEPNINTLKSWITSIRAVANNNTGDKMIAAQIPTHRGGGFK